MIYEGCNTYLQTIITVGDKGWEYSVDGAGSSSAAHSRDLVSDVGPDTSVLSRIICYLS
jgi:hypothetical protein